MLADAIAAVLELHKQSVDVRRLVVVCSCGTEWTQEEIVSAAFPLVSAHVAESIVIDAGVQAEVARLFDAASISRQGVRGSL
jgi:hypothetical protein